MIWGIYPMPTLMNPTTKLIPAIPYHARIIKYMGDDPFEKLTK
jgi:hypothetical protein